MRLAVLLVHTNQRERVQHILQQLTAVSNVDFEVFVLDNGCVDEEKLEPFLHQFHDLSVLHERSEQELSYGASYNVLIRRALVGGFDWVWLVDSQQPFVPEKVVLIMKKIVKHVQLGAYGDFGLWLSGAALRACGGFHEPYFWGVYFVNDLLTTMQERGYAVQRWHIQRDIPQLPLHHYFAARNPFLFAFRHPAMRTRKEMQRLFAMVYSGLQRGWSASSWRSMGLAAHGWFDGWKILLGTPPVPINEKTVTKKSTRLRYPKKQSVSIDPLQPLHIWYA